ncbi:MAG: PDZ domain-containing protein [Pseudomonadales bacterium]
MTRPMPWLLLLALCASPVLAAETQPPAPPAPPDMEKIEQRMDEARRQLDEAALRLAELQREMYRLESSGPGAQRPMIGILFTSPGDAAGLPLAGVTPDGGAAQAGLQAGDVIVAINGTRLDGGGDEPPLKILQRLMKDVEIGDRVSIEYRRDGTVSTATIETQSHSQFMRRMMEGDPAQLEAFSSVAGKAALAAAESMKLDLDMDLDADTRGVLRRLLMLRSALRLEDVSGSLASYFHVDRGVLVLAVPETVDALQPGDILLRVGDVEVADADAAIDSLKGLSDETTLQIKRKGRERTVTVDGKALADAIGTRTGNGRFRFRFEPGTWDSQGSDDADREVRVIVIDSGEDGAGGADGKDASRDGD